MSGRIRRRLARVAWLACAIASSAGCAGEVAERHGVVAKVRPTEGDSAVFDGYGAATALHVDSPDGLVRVWYAATGPHAPPATDSAPADGIPDMVQRVAETADAVAVSLESDGFALPVSDESIPGIDDGGSAAFDIYLVDFARADGLFFAEGCLEGEPSRCAGYIAIKNDFSRSGYASLEEAITVLVSHEYFHAVQAAYTADLPSWWSEGTATWHEEYFDASQDDFERLANSYFAESGRALNGTVQGPADTFAYGTAVFATFVEQTAGVEVLVDVFERLGRGDALEEAIVAAIERQRPFDEAFAEFAAWTLCTGERAVDGFGFEMAAELDALELDPLDGASDLNWDVEIRSWAHEPAMVERPRPLRLSVRAIEGWPLTPLLVVVDPAMPGSFSLVREGETVDVAASDEPLWLTLVNADPEQRTAGRLAIRAVPTDPCADSGDLPECESDDGSGAQVDDATGDDSGGGCAAAPAGISAIWCSLVALVGLTRRRRNG